MLQEIKSALEELGIDEIPDADLETLKPLLDIFRSGIRNITEMGMENVPPPVLEIVNGVSNRLETEDFLGALVLANSINITVLSRDLEGIPIDLMQMLGDLELTALGLEKGAAQALIARVAGQKGRSVHLRWQTILFGNKKDVVS